MLFRPLICLLLCTCVLACIPPGDEPVYEGVVLDLNDETTRAIYDHQNARRADSLLRYLADDDVSHRYQAARAFGSFPSAEPPVTDSLLARLTDKEPLVRRAAAYALGQLGDETVGRQLPRYFDGSGNFVDYNASLLAAVGKTADRATLDQVAGVTTYEPTDTALLAGQAWSIYYFARRKITSPAGTARLLTLLTDPATPERVRHPAAFYFQRFADQLDSNQTDALRRLLRSDADPLVQMGAARALGRSGSGPARVALLRQLEDATDWRLRTEILRALGGFDYPSVREAVIESLRDKHPLVALAAVDFLVEHGAASDATNFRTMARDSIDPAIRFGLYRAAQRHLPYQLTDYREGINYELQQAYAATSDNTQRAAILAALGEYPWNYRRLWTLYQQADSPVTRSAAAEALYGISKREDFDAFFRGSARRVRYELSQYFQEMITSREVGPAYYAAGALTATPEAFAVFYPDRTWLDQALNGFKLPREIETWRAVEAARVALSPETEIANTGEVAGAKPIDWDRLGTDGKRDVLLRVPGGKIVLQLWPEVAPATVSSFLELVSQGYYDGKAFHRVVPNFVAQGGGPRGDGFGGEDFIIRTETPELHWDRPGLIGMASAGKDTEGVQFFFTHGPTPHLDGNYTIFGAITEGQDILDRIVPGTPIESIQLR